MKRFIVALGIVAVCAGAHEAPSKVDSAKSSEGRPENPLKDCADGNWTTYSSIPNEEGAFPETNVTYLRYLFQWDPKSGQEFTIAGTFPKGRYMGFTIYEYATKNYVDGIADFELSDKIIQGETKYTVKVTDGEIPSPRKPGTLYLPQTKDGKPQIFEIWYRIYVPKDGAMNYGEVPRPQIFGTNKGTGATQCPSTYSKKVPLRRKMDLSQVVYNKPPSIEPGGEYPFVLHRGLGLYPNFHTRYLSVSLSDLRFKSEEKPIYSMRFKPPPTVGLNKDVRFWSICLGSGLSTATPTDCIIDSQATVDADGYVTFYFGPGEFSARAKEKKLNYLSMDDAVFPIVIYRHLLSSENYAGKITRLEVWPTKAITESEDLNQTLLTSEKKRYMKEAESKLGAYYPTGKTLPLKEFEALLR